MDGLNTYKANAACGNCGFEGPVTPELGKHVSKHPCPVCQYPGLQPTSGEERARRIREGLT